MYTYPEHISNEDLSLLPIGSFPGVIEIIEDEHNLSQACNYLLSQPAIGFDTETRPSFRPGIANKTALLQLSTHERCFLFRLCRMRLDKAIIKILENKKILKIGAAIDGDLHGLQQLRRFRPDGFVDLQHMVEKYGIAEKSVRKMSAIVLGMSISKAQRLSNWEAARFTPSQIRYAATDAWVCLEIYNKLKSENQ